MGHAWAEEDAEFAKPLKPNLTRITPEDLQQPNNLDARRNAYVAEFRKLGIGGRQNELKRLKRELGDYVSWLSRTTNRATTREAAR